MKLTKNPLFWSIVVNFVFAIVVLVLSFTRKPIQVDFNSEKIREIDSLNLIINNYEKDILLKNSIIDSYNNDELDSVWSAIQRQGFNH